MKTINNFQIVLKDDEVLKILEKYFMDNKFINAKLTSFKRSSKKQEFIFEAKLTSGDEQ